MVSEKEDTLKESLVPVEIVTPKLKPLTFSESCKTVLKLTYNPIIGSFFHPVYSIVNASVLGHSGDPA